jgi:hypothetical protein
MKMTLKMPWQSSFLLLAAILFSSSCVARKFGDAGYTNEQPKSGLTSVEDLEGAESCPAEQRNDNRRKLDGLLKMLTASGCAGLMIYNNLLSAGTLLQLDEKYFPGFAFNCRPAATNEDVVQFDRLQKAAGEFDQNLTAIKAPAVGRPTQCELPAEMEDVLPKIKDRYRWWLARLFIAHATFAGASGMIIGEQLGTPSHGRFLSGRFLYHYMEGTGNPVEIKDTKAVEGLKEIFLAQWEKAGKPDSGRFFIDYQKIYSNSKIGSQDSYALVHSLGRFFLYFQKIDNSSFEVAINDLYLWPRLKARTVNGVELPKRFRAGRWHGLQGEVFETMKRITGAQNQYNDEYSNGDVSEERWAAFQNVGAKNFRMVVGAVVNVTKQSITALSPKDHDALMRRIQQGNFDSLQQVNQVD